MGSFRTSPPSLITSILVAPTRSPAGKIRWSDRVIKISKDMS